MYYIFEALCVGVYCVLLYEILAVYVFDFNVLLFFLGFTKHLLGYELQLHTFFCNYGYSCQRIKHSRHRRAYTGNLDIIGESVLEGFVFLFIGYLLSRMTKNKLLIVFSIGVMLHIFAELAGLHTYFCQRCK